MFHRAPYPALRDSLAVCHLTAPPKRKGFKREPAGQSIGPADILNCKMRS